MSRTTKGGARTWRAPRWRVRGAVWGLLGLSAAVAAAQPSASALEVLSDPSPPAASAQPSASAPEVLSDPSPSVTHPTRAPSAEAKPRASSADATPSATSELDPDVASREMSALLRTSRISQPELSQLEERAALPPALRNLEQELPARTRELFQENGRARKQIHAATRWFTLVDIEYGIRRRRTALQAQKRQVDAHVARTEEAVQRVQAILADAELASEEAANLRMGVAVQGQLRRSVNDAKLARLHVRRSQASAQRLQAVLADSIEELDQTLRIVATEGPSLVRDATRSGPGLVRALASVGADLSRRDAMTRALGHSVATLSELLRESGHRLFLQLLLGLGTLASLLWLRARGGARLDPPPRSLRTDPLHQPIAAAGFVAALCSPLLYPEYPASAVVLAATTTALLGLRLVRGADPALRGWHRSFLHLLLVLEVSRYLVTELDGVERLLLLGEGLLGLGAVAWALRSERRSSPPPLTFRARWRRLVLAAWATVFATGVAALATGLVLTGTALVSGATISLLGAAVWTSAHRLATAAVRALTAPQSLEGSPRARERAAWIADRAALALQAVFALLWIRTTLDALTLWDPSVELARGAFSVSAELGSLRVSVGSLATLVLGLVLAVYVAKAVRSILEEDVLSRTSLTTGTRAATSTSAYYGMLVVGIFLAVGAAGVELEKLTIIAGALGVGVGFGLQNIVQNFVAGLILIFGRPVNVDDRIQIGELLGVVRKIGFRSSLLRTFQGADVIVPNSDLISAQVTNWTLSDPDRRLDIDVGVAYGTDPEQVQRLLLGVAHAHPDVLATPAPEALFLAHGASSLDFQLRAWTQNFLNWPKVRSDLTVAVNRALTAANIEIPFPQRDLHLKSVSPAALAELRRHGGSRGD